MQRRKYLNKKEIDKIIQNIPESPNSIRDRCILLMCYIHGLRISELIKININDLDMIGKNISIFRLKKGFSTIHPLQPEEFRILKKWLTIRKNWKGNESNSLFLSRKGTPLSRQRLYKLFKICGDRANLGVHVHPHMFRHACGYALAESGKDTRLIQDYLGHKNIRHTVLYTASNPERFSSIEF